MLFILLFLYAFLKDNLFRSTIPFYVANTISPLSALSFTLFLLKGSNKKTIIRAFAVGIGALCLYILTFLLIDLDVSVLFGKVSEEMEGRGLLYRIMILGVFIFLNFLFNFLYIIKFFSHR